MTAAIVLSIVDVLALLGIVWFASWQLGKWYAVLRADRDDMRRFTDRAIEAMERIAAGCVECHRDVVATIGARASQSDDLNRADARNAEGISGAATVEIIRALRKKEERIIGTIEHLLFTLRSDALSAPPVGSAGSTVRDSVEGAR